MNEQNIFGYQQEAPGQPVMPGDPAQPPLGAPFQGPYKFSPDEVRVMAQCNRESFYQRSLPLSTAFGVGTYMALQKGYFKPNPRFGALPKMSLAVLVGYFIGKLSYQQACAEKLMALPGSYIGQLLRERRDGRAGTTMTKQSPTMFGAGPNDIYSDAGPGSSLDLDTDRPVFNEDTYRPDNEGSGAPADPERKQGPSLSYEDLRRKNRGDYSEVRQDPYRMDPSALPPIGRPRPASPAPPPPANTNKYGDIMD
ncbi:OCIA domain-containing protein asrij isoform X2 [Choristoneura fumiferana]|uniref:OCIA domain-containing protein asrij isoform X2 n=1 Tax=Choristoneura fumiferana TaxID=7141 RepID=UPI003D15F11E